MEIAAAVLSIVAIGFTLGPKIEAAFDSPDSAHLEIDEVTVSNPPAAYLSSGAPELLQDPATEPTVAATVRNRGDDTAWIEEARITVIDGARLSTCVTQGGGDVPQSKRYRIELPEFPGGQRRVFRRDLHVEVQPGHGVRPVLSFQKRLIATTNLYAIRVELVADPGQRLLDVGRFVIGVPEPPSRSGEILPESDEVLLSEAIPLDEPMDTSCFRHNLEGMRRVSAQPGLRSDYVAALAQMQPAPAWASYAGRPARIVVEELLKGFHGEYWIYAIEAAAQTGDPRYEEEVRRRAIAKLLQSAEDSIARAPGIAVENAERVLSLGPSPAAGRLLAGAKAAVRALEERQQEELEEIEAAGG